MGFLNYNKIFDIDILNLETRGVVHELTKMADTSKWILDYFIGYTHVKGKVISIFLQIWTRKYVYIWNLTCTWSDTIRPCQNIHRNAPGDQILNFQNTLDRAWNEIRMKNRQKISSKS
jgi:hypothetical protein